MLCPWARHITGRPAFMWKTGAPDTTKMATPMRVRTSRPKHSDTIREWRIKINKYKYKIKWQKNVMHTNGSEQGRSACFPKQPNDKFKQITGSQIT